MTKSLAVRALVLVFVVGGCASPQSSTDTAEPTSEEPTGLEPADPVERAAMRIERKDYAEAERIIADALEKQPDNHELWFARGVVAREQGQAEKAIEAWNETLARKADFEPALNGLGALYLEAGNHDKAVEVLARAVQINPEFAEAQYNLGLALLRSNQAAKAVTALEAATALDPDDTEIKIELANALLALDRPKDALTVAKKAVDQAPNDPVAHAGVGHVLSRLGNHDEALGHLRRAVELAPEDPGAKLALAQALMRAGKGDQLQEAAKLLEALASTHEAALVFSEWGAVLAKLGDFEPALEKLNRASELDASLLSPYVRRIGVLADLGRCKAARDDLTKLRERQPPADVVKMAERVVRQCK